MTPRKKPPDLWTTSQVADFLGYTGRHRRASARKQMIRWGIRPGGRQVEQPGELMWPAEQIRRAHANRTGQGRRTDLHPRQENPDDPS